MARAIKKNKITFVFDGGEGGGIVEYQKLLLTHIDRSDLIIEGIFLGDGNSFQKLFKLYDIVKIISKQRLVNNFNDKKKVKRKLCHFYYGLIGLKNLYIYMKKSKPNLIVTHYIPHNLFASLVAGILRIKIVWHWHGAKSFNFINKSFYYFITKYTPNKIITISNFVKENIPSKKSDQVSVVYNGINVSENTSRNEIETKLKRNEKYLLVGIVGSIAKVKGHDVFIEMAKIVLEMVNNVHFVIVGDESESSKRKIGLKSTLMAKVKNYGLEDNITFVGRIDNVKYSMSDLDLLCVPSIPIKGIKGEGFGLAMIEGMLRGVPVVASKFGAFPEIIENRVDGIIINPFDIVEFSKAVISLLMSSEKRLEIGVNGQNKVKNNFNVIDTYKKVLNEYKAVIG